VRGGSPEVNRKYSRRSVAGGRVAGGGGQTDDAHVGADSEAVRASRLGRHNEDGGNRRRETPERVARRPDPDAWSQDELLGLHEAVALLWPRGPLTVSSLRTAIASGALAYVRIAGRIYTTIAALAAMAECRRTTAAGRGGG
jgi:hypothetical protein